MTQEISPIVTTAKASTAVEQNTLKRRGVGLRACDPERACPGYTLFAPCFEQNRTVCLIDLQGSVVHTWTMPYAPGLGGYLTERGTLIYNGRTLENGFRSRFPFKGGAILEADWNRKILWEVRHPDHHHDGIRLRNGNVLLNCLGQVPKDIAERVVGGTEDHNLSSGLYGRQPQAEVGRMYADYLAELTPSGPTVWEWRSWEHLDPAENGIAEVQSLRTALPHLRASMLRLRWRTATFSSSTTAFTGSTIRPHFRGSSRSTRRRTRSCGRIRTTPSRISSRRVWVTHSGCRTGIR
jgi:hypothetical protein